MRGQSPAVENLDIEFSRGEFVFLVGASGSGKSTLMRMILKEVTPTRGVVYVAGKDLSRIPSWREPSLRRDIGMVFQEIGRASCRERVEITVVDEQGEKKKRERNRR